MTAELLAALYFAAEKHRCQRRKDVDASAFINHPIEVAEILARVASIDDRVTLLAAVLHDTIEDTKTTAEELTAHFGAEVSAVVVELTDDKDLDKEVRKEYNVTHAPRLSARAKKIKLADLSANVRSLVDTPPADWPKSRIVEYMDWSERVAKGLRGTSGVLERHYDQTLARSRQMVG